MVAAELLADFLARMALGLAASALTVASRKVGEFYFRVVALVLVGLTTAAGLVAGWTVVRVVLFCGAGLAAASFAAWGLDPAGRARSVGSVVMALTAAAAAAALALMAAQRAGSSAAPLIWTLADSLTSAGLLGAMLATMLLGHSYNVIPTTSTGPLLRLTLVVVGALAMRAAIAGCVLATTMAADPTTAADYMALGDATSALTAARWLVGLAAPAVVVALVWPTAKMGSFQSATGILYVGLLLTCCGELLGELASPPGLPL